MEAPSEFVEQWTRHVKGLVPQWHGQQHKGVALAV